MSSLSPKDRVSLCIFSYADGRRCRTPRIASHPHFCYDHAQKESRAATADKLAKDLSAFFSAHDVSTALARLIPAVVRGDIKPRTARTVAYMAQTLLQSIHLAQSEFKDAFGPDALRKSVRSGITSNHDRLFPPDSQPQPYADPATATLAATITPTQPASPLQSPVASPTPVAAAHPVCHPERSEGPRLDPASPTNAETRPTAATQSTIQSPEPNNQPTTPTPVPRQRPYNPTGDPYVTYFDHTYRLREPEKAY